MSQLLPAPGFRARFRRLYAAGTAFFWLLLLLLAAAHPSRAQCPNDDLENRWLLRLEETVAASTTGCTVQRRCVDERLTGKCIEYHNDQWFEFTPPAAGRYFVNIGGQQCRDVRGVQLVVLSGQPCQPATYRILSCTSLGTQDDVFVTLDSLAAGRPYLLCVDGYLKDYCRFTLQISHQALGLPVSYQPPNPVRLQPVGGVVELAWQVPDSLALAGTTACRVLRREVHQYRSVEVAQVPLRHDTFGRPQSAYTWRDSLPAPGQYHYRVVSAGAAHGAAPALLLAQWVANGEPAPAMPGPAVSGPTIRLPLNEFPRRAALTIVVTEPGSGRVLLARQLQRDPAQPQQDELPVAAWQAQGIRQVAVAIGWQPKNGRKSSRQFRLTLPAPEGLSK